MALVVKDRIKETTATTGTGTLTLDGAVTKFQSFSVVGDGNTTYYAIESGNGTDWEIGVGTYTASGTTLSRDTILESSNAGSAINLSGTSVVFCTYPAERSVNTADIGTTIQAYDADTTKNDVANTFTANQTINGDLTVDTDTLYVDSTNNRVGIGTASPTTNLTIVPSSVANGIDIVTDPADSTRSGRLFFSNNTAGEAITLRNDAASLVFATGATVGSSSGTERMRIDPSGSVGIGTTSPSTSRLRIYSAGTTSATIGLRVSDSAGVDLFYARSDGRINTGDKSASPYNQTTGSAANMYVDGNGTLYRSTSSLKYKTDVQDNTHGLDDIMKLRAVTYKGKSEDDGDTVFGGLIAEEVHDAGLTEFVQYDNEGKPDALAYGHMVSLAFKAIQEQQDIIEALETRIQSLESK